MTEKRKIYDDAFGMDPEDLEEKQPVNSVVPIYANVFEQIQLLPESDRHIVYDAICKYGLYEEKPDHLPLLAHMIFLGTKPNIDSYYRDRINGKKGGRPRKKKEEPQEDEDEEEHKPKVKTIGKNNLPPDKHGKSINNKTPVKTPVKTYTDTDTDKETEKDTETDTEISVFCNTFSFKEPKAGNASAGRQPASVPGFSFDSCLQCRDDNSLDLTDEQVKQFYDWMTGNGWKINGQPVKILKNAMKGYAKKQNHSAGIVETFTDEARMEKQTPLYYGLYQNCKRMISSAKAVKLYQKEIETFFTSDLNYQWDYISCCSGLDGFIDLEKPGSGFPDISDADPAHPEAIPNYYQWLKDTPQLYQTAVIKVLEKAVKEVSNSIPDSKQEEMEKDEIREYVINKFKKYFTYDELEELWNADLFYELF